MRFCAPHVCLVSSRGSRGSKILWNWSHRWVWSTVWVLGNKPRSLNHWATSPAPALGILKTALAFWVILKSAETYGTSCDSLKTWKAVTFRSLKYLEFFIQVPQMLLKRPRKHSFIWPVWKWDLATYLTLELDRGSLSPTAPRGWHSAPAPQDCLFPLVNRESTTNLWGTDIWIFPCWGSQSGPQTQKAKAYHQVWSLLSADMPQLETSTTQRYVYA